MDTKKFNLDILNTFNAIEEAIQGIQKECRDGADGITEIHSKLNKADEKLDDIYKISHGLNIINKSVNAVKKTVEFLSVVPVIGVVCQQLNRILGIAKKGISPIAKTASQGDQYVKDFRKAVQKTNSILQQVHYALEKTDNVIETRLPNIRLTKEIVETLDEILRLIGSNSLNENINRSIHKFCPTFETTLEKAKTSINSSAEIISNAQNEIDASVKKVNSFVSEIQENTSGFVKGIKSIETVLSPIGQALNYALNILKPLKWILDAASYLFNLILKPIIDTLLKATGLDRLFIFLEEEICRALHIDELKEIMEKKIIELKSILTSEVENELNKIGKELESVKDQFELIIQQCDFQNLETMIKNTLAEFKEKLESEEMKDWEDIENISVLSFQTDNILPKCSIYQPLIYHNEIQPLDNINEDNDYEIKLIENKSAKNLKCDPITNQINDIYTNFEFLLANVNQFNQLIFNSYASIQKMSNYKNEVNLYHSLCEDCLNLLNDANNIFFNNIFDLSTLTNVIESHMQECNLYKRKLKNVEAEYEKFTNKIDELKQNMPTQHDFDQLCIDLFSIKEIEAITSNSLFFKKNNDIQINNDCEKYDIQQKRIDYLKQYNQHIVCTYQSIYNKTNQLDNYYQMIKKIGVNDSINFFSKEHFEKLSLLNNQLLLLHSLSTPIKHLEDLLIPLVNKNFKLFFVNISDKIQKMKTEIIETCLTNLFDSTLTILNPISSFDIQMDTVLNETSELLTLMENDEWKIDSVIQKLCLSNDDVYIDLTRQYSLLDSTLNMDNDDIDLLEENLALIENIASHMQLVSSPQKEDYIYYIKDGFILYSKMIQMARVFEDFAVNTLCNQARHQAIYINSVIDCILKGEEVREYVVYKGNFSPFIEVNMENLDSIYDRANKMFQKYKVGLPYVLQSIKEDDKRNTVEKLLSAKSNPFHILG